MPSNNDSIEEEVFGDRLEPSDVLRDESVSSDDPVIGSPDQSENSNTTMAGIKKTIAKSNLNNQNTPGIASGDIDADWQDDQNTGEEGSLGSVETPDQSEVDDVSEPWGLNQPADESLDISKKRSKLNEERKHIEEENLKN